jgi:hypothetical protein
MQINPRLFIFLTLGLPALLVGQQPFVEPFNHTFQHLDRHLYNNQVRFHTSVKPYLRNQTDTIAVVDSIDTIETSKKIWNIVFNRNLVKQKLGVFSFTIDPILHFELGRDNDFSDNSWINTRGVLIRASIGNNFAISTSFAENQAVFNDYRSGQIARISQRVIPGQGIAKKYKDKPNGFDYYFSEAYVSYSPSTFFNFQLGTGKNFFGDGYRSLLLSDNSFSYPYFKITTDVWNIKYVNLWTQFQHLRDRMPDVVAHTKKWGAFQYLSWNATKWLNVSLFEAVIWKDRDTLGHRGFDVQYANPVIYLRPTEWSLGSPDNMLVGASGKITLFKNTALYGQIVLDEFKLNELKEGNGWYANKWGIQAGLKTFDLFRVKRLDFQTELNVVRPFMYSHTDPVTNYAHFNQPLAHPLGSNFAESVTFLRYGYRRISVELQFMFAKHGADTANLNYGNDMFLPYSTYAQPYGNTFFQSEEVNLKIIRATAHYLVNPNYNLNIFAGIQIRDESSATLSRQQKLITFGIRTSLQNFYWDF